MSSGQYTARPEAMRSTVGNVGGILMRAISMLQAFERLSMDPASLASIGSAVSSASIAMADHEASALRSLLSLLQTYSSRVYSSADRYQEADAAVAASYLGRPVPAPPEPGIWSSPAGRALASQAARDGAAGGAPTPHRAESIIGYLAGADLGQLGRGGQDEPPLSLPAGSAAELMAWLADSPGHQAQLGVVAVYAGAARGLDDTPGGLRPGDLVAIEPGTDAADRQVSIGVVGEDGGLYNSGPFSPDFGGIAQLHVYRPFSDELPGTMAR